MLSGRESTIRVSESTRLRILAAANELGYSPHPIGQALRHGRSNIIGFVGRSTPHGPFDESVPYILNIEIARAAAELGYYIVETGYDSNHLESSMVLARALRSHHVDGVIFDSPTTLDAVKELHNIGLPIVQLMRPQLGVETPTVTVEANYGVTAAVDHLVTLGHRRIAFIGSPSSHPVDRERLDTFREALAKHAIELPAEYLQLDVDATISVGLNLAEKLLQLHTPPTAIIAAGDNLALGSMRAFYRADVHVPNDISVVSYDDTLAEYVYPPLTSVTQPLRGVAERALELLISDIDRDALSVHEVRHVVLPTSLTIRASTAPPSTIQGG